MFNKLKQQFNQITKKKAILDEFEDKGFDIDLNNLWKYPPQDLHGLIMNYEKFLEKIRKKGADLHEENLANKEKFAQFEIEKNQINSEKQLLKSQLEHFYSVVEQESKEKEKLKTEIENFKGEKNNIENSQKSDRSQTLKTDENYEFSTPKLQEMLNDSQKAFELLMSEISSNELNNNLKALVDKINSNIENKPAEEINMVELIEDINSKNLIFEILAEKTKEHLDNFKSSIEKFSDYLAETRDKNQIDSKEKQELVKRNESLSLSLEKSEKIRTDLENDLMIMSERISGLKNENATLNSNLNEMKQKFKNEEKLKEDFFLQNKAYAEEIKMMKDKISSVVMEKSKMEENSSNDIREQRNLLENYKNTSVKLEETLKEKEEANTLRQRDLENKIIQERLRLDQKMKDLSKIEELYSQAKTDLTQQIESNNKLMEKISLLEMKMTSDKKLFKEERKKNKQLSKQIVDLQSKNWNENDEREQKIQIMEKEKGELMKEIHEMKKKAQTQFSKEIEIKNLEIKVAEFSNEISELKEKISLYEEKICESENLKYQYQSEIKQLQNKREAALEEIRRLNQKITKTAKPEKVEVVFDKLDKSQYPNKEPYFLTLLKKEMESVYREYIQILPLEKNTDYLNGFIKIEKKLNDVIRRAQDYIDNLEGN